MIPFLFLQPPLSVIPAQPVYSGDTMLLAARCCSRLLALCGLLCLVCFSTLAPLFLLLELRARTSPPRPDLLLWWDHGTRCTPAVALRMAAVYGVTKLASPGHCRLPFLFISGSPVPSTVLDTQLAPSVCRWDDGWGRSAAHSVTHVRLLDCLVDSLVLSDVTSAHCGPSHTEPFCVASPI